MTTELPYTDADLRAEAITQHAGLTEDPDFMGVGEAMCDTAVQSTNPDPDAETDTGRTWVELLPYEADGGEAYNAAQIKIHDLIRGAADVSEWAINLGSDGLEPTGHRIEIEGPDGGVAVRLHFAFDADMPDVVRDSVVADLVTAISPRIPLLPQT